jgi:zinc finger FYVE domain-containing protein 26
MFLDLNLFYGRYYLEKYGRPESALSFFLRHKMLEKACCYVVERQLPNNFFVEHIVEFCLSHSLLSELKQTLKKIGTEIHTIGLSDSLNLFVCVLFKMIFLTLFVLDPTLESFHDYLLAACKYFNQQKAFKTLVTFQIFMKDYVRAGLTCIKIFLDTLDHNYKLKCLEVAKVQRHNINRILEHSRFYIL